MLGGCSAVILGHLERSAGLGSNQMSYDRFEIIACGEVLGASRHMDAVGVRKTGFPSLSEDLMIGGSALRSSIAREDDGALEDWVLLWTALRRLGSREQALSALRAVGDCSQGADPPKRAPLVHVVDRIHAGCETSGIEESSAGTAPTARGADEPERGRLRCWLADPARRRQLLAIALFVLSNREDAEDAVHAYFAPREDRRKKEPCPLPSRLDMDLDNYDPTRGELLPYLESRFKFFCQSRREERESRIAREIPLSMTFDDGAELEVEFVGFSSASPEEDALRSERYAAILDCVERLPRLQRAVVVLHYFKERSCEEAAAANGLAVGYVKVLLSRARHNLRPCLARKGLS